MKKKMLFKPPYCRLTRMRSPANGSLGKALIMGTLIMLFFSVSCSGLEYTTQHFSFPPDSKPHEGEWQYMMLIVVSSDKRPITARSKKIAEIKVHDQSDTIFLNEDFEFTCASVRANITWEKFEEIKVELLEVGNKFAKDLYNKQLLKSGPKRLLELTYQYDQKDKKFKRSN